MRALSLFHAPIIPAQVGQSAIHPVIRSVGDQGRALFVNRHFTRRVLSQRWDFLFDEPTEVALGAAENASSAVEDADLLSTLFDHIVSYGEQHGLRVSWQEGDLVMWHEPTTQHAAQHDYAGRRREMHRVLISGPRPI